MRTSARALSMTASAALAAAGGLHATAAHEHVDASPMVAPFFLVVALAQLATAWFVMARPTRWVASVATAGSAGLLALWAVSRTVGVPFSAEGVEALGALDISAAALEVIAIVLLAPLIAWGPAPRLQLRAVKVGVLVAAFAASAGLGAHFALPAHDHRVASHGHSVADAKHSHP